MAVQQKQDSEKLPLDKEREYTREALFSCFKTGKKEKFQKLPADLEAQIQFLEIETLKDFNGVYFLKHWVSRPKTYTIRVGHWAKAISIKNIDPFSIRIKRERLIFMMNIRQKIQIPVCCVI